MPDKKLTDLEIVKALKSRMYKENKYMFSLLQETLDLINRLQAENEDIKFLYENLKEEHLEIIKAIKHTKAEAYKEVFEKLNDKAIVTKMKLYGNWFILKGVTLHNINALKKELVGEE